MTKYGETIFVAQVKITAFDIGEMLFMKSFQISFLLGGIVLVGWLFLWRLYVGVLLFESIYRFQTRTKQGD